jgi:sugar phosphate isomerase/epimerase
MLRPYNIIPVNYQRISIFSFKFSVRKSFVNNGVIVMEFAICYGGLDNPQATTNVLLENEISIIETGADFFLNSDDEKIKQTAKAFIAKNITIRSVHAPFGSDFNLSNFDEEKRNKAIEVHEELLYKTSLADVEMIIIHPGEQVSSKEDIEKMSKIAIDSISQLIGTAEETGVRLAVENMPAGCPGCEVQHIVDILEKIESLSLGVCFDTGHAHIMGQMQEFIEALGVAIINVHLHDNDSTFDMHLQPPYGTIDWRVFAETLQNVGYDEILTIEAAPWTGASFKQMVREVSAVIENALSPDEWQNSNANMALRCLKCGHAILRSKGQWFCNCTYGA